MPFKGTEKKILGKNKISKGNWLLDPEIPRLSSPIWLLWNNQKNQYRKKLAGLLVSFLELTPSNLSELRSAKLLRSKFLEASHTINCFTNRGPLLPIGVMSDGHRSSQCFPIVSLSVRFCHTVFSESSVHFIYCSYEADIRSG